MESYRDDLFDWHLLTSNHCLCQSVELRLALGMLTTLWSLLKLLIVPARISYFNEQPPWNLAEKYPVIREIPASLWHI